MKPTAEIEAKGTQAYEQARAFERLRTWRLPVTYIVFPILPLIIGVVVLEMGHETMAMLQFGVAILFAIGAWFQWRRLLTRYARNVELLAELEREYGDQLPWIQVENYFAELEDLRREMEEERARRG
jgi:hypothetical protein